MRTVSRRARARQARQGAALVEGLIVCTLLAIFLACIVLLHDLYGTKIASTHLAREQAWARSLPGCEGGLSMLLLNALTGGMLDVLVVADGAEIIDTPAWMTNHGRGVGEHAAGQVRADTLLGGQAFSLRSRVAVACNEFGDDEEGSLLVNGADIVRDLIPGILDR